MAKRHELPTDAAFWKEFNESIMEFAPELYFLRLPGWKESLGFGMELEWHINNPRPAFWVDPMPFNHYALTPIDWNTV